MDKISSVWATMTSSGSQVASLIFGTIFTITLACSCYHFSENSNDRWFNLIICIFGVSIGWLLGLALSPYDSTEHNIFSSVAKTVSAFISGYLISKLDSPIQAIIAKLTETINGTGGLTSFKPSRVNAFRIIAFVISIICSTIVVYSSRAYDGTRFIKKPDADSLRIQKLTARVDSLKTRELVISKKIDSLMTLKPKSTE